MLRFLLPPSSKYVSEEALDENREPDEKRDIRLCFSIGAYQRAKLPPQSAEIEYVFRGEVARLSMQAPFASCIIRQRRAIDE